jgi:hypothetical protein
MPPLISATPAILDHSFPRNEDELRIVAVALGEIQLLLQDDSIHLIITQVLGDLIREFDWTPSRRFSLLNDVYRLLAQLFLQPHDRLVSINTTVIDSASPHPILEGLSSQGLVEIWADELGKVLQLHDRCCNRGEFFIGIACERAFAGMDKGTYGAGVTTRAFPIVGPSDLSTLADAYEWVIPEGAHRKQVSFRDAKRNCRLIGAIAVDSPQGDSHFKVRFPGSRPWTLDPNDDPIPEPYLRELVDITGLPLGAIKAALADGIEPERRLRLV